MRLSFVCINLIFIAEPQVACCLAIVINMKQDDAERGVRDSTDAEIQEIGSAAPEPQLQGTPQDEVRKW